MCTSLILVNKFDVGFRLNVPCSNCLECRNASQDSWLFRLGSDLKDLYSRRGKAVFLTFSYNNHCLNHSDFGFTDRAPIPCFNSDDVSRFLNKVKVFANRTYGPGSYKYFVCSEYGKFTKRPHLHAIFMLEPRVNFQDFVEKCRVYWTFGYTFPRFVNGRYVDNNFQPTSPLLHSVQNACAYAVKYVTKDLDFFGLDLVKLYVDKRNDLPEDIRRHYNKYLPHHFQSKGIGSSYLSSISSADTLSSCVSHGVINPCTMRLCQLPRYYVEKLCFTHERRFFNGKPFVLRQLNPRYFDVVRSIHFNSFQSRSLSYANFFASINLNLFKSYGYKLDDFRFIRQMERFGSDALVVRSFLRSLDPRWRWYFYFKNYPISLDGITSLRMDMYSLEFIHLPSKFSVDEDIDRFNLIFSNISDSERAKLIDQRYQRYLISKKLRLMSKNLI